MKYAGPVHYAAGTYVGVEMDQTSVGKNNGINAASLMNLYNV